MDEATLNNLVLALVTIAGAVFTAFWVAFIIWTYNDMKARSRDPLAQIAAGLVVAVLNIFGLMIYVMLRPRETLADAYERSLEEEALLQEIEEKPACPGCGRATKEQWQVCPYCHSSLKKICYHCNALLELSWNLCPICATPQVTETESHEALMERANVREVRRPGAKSPYDVGQPIPTPKRPAQSVQAENLEWVDSDY